MCKRSDQGDWGFCRQLFDDAILSLRTHVSCVDKHSTCQMIHHINKRSMSTLLVVLVALDGCADMAFPRTLQQGLSGIWRHHCLSSCTELRVAAQQDQHSARDAVTKHQLHPVLLPGFRMLKRQLQCGATVSSYCMTCVANMILEQRQSCGCRDCDAKR